LRQTLYATTVGVALASVGVVVAAWVTLHRVRPTDVTVAAALLLAALASFLALRRGGTRPGLYALAGTSAAALPLLTGLWMPSLYVTDSRSVAAELRSRYGGGRYCFIADGPYLPLCFSMRSVIPNYRSADALKRSPDSVPGLLVLTRPPETRDARREGELPSEFVRLGTVGARDEQFRVYRFDPTQTTPRRPE
jgi:hypothetical protein